jgi:hypothetical protein
MKCGDDIRVKDLNQSHVVRFIAQCNGRYLVIANPTVNYMNGYLLMDWKQVLRQIIGLTVPEKLIEKRLSIESNTLGEYHCLPLTYPLSANGLAAILGVSGMEVRVELSDILMPNMSE